MSASQAGNRRSTSAWGAPVVLLLALSAVFVFSGDRGHFYRPSVHDFVSLQHLALADSLLDKPFLFFRARRTSDGSVKYNAYNRFPIGGYVLIKLAIAPFEGDGMSAQIFAARMLMLAFFAAAALLGYVALAALTDDRAVALGATLLAFSSLYALGYADAISTECSPALFALMLVFHGMVRFSPGETDRPPRFAQLLVKVCVALLLDWHVYGLLLPFIVFGIAGAAVKAWRTQGPSSSSLPPPPPPPPPRAGALAAAVLVNRHALLAAFALVLGVGLLGYNLLAESQAYGGGKSISQLPSARSALLRTGLDDTAHRGVLKKPWLEFVQWQLHWIGVMSTPFAVPGLPTIWVNLPNTEWAQPRLAWVGALAVAVCLLGLVGVRRQRALFGVLTVAGFCWAVPMRNQTEVPDHDFEALAYIGIPLTAFSLLLLAVRHLPLRPPWGSRCVGGLALCAALVFALAAVRVSRVGLDAEAKTREQALLAEFETIRQRIQGGEVLVASNPDAILYLLHPRRKFWYYTAGSMLQYEDHSDAHGRAADFVLSLERIQSEALLTPSHRFFFLYEGLGAWDEIGQARRRAFRRIAADEPAARADWNVHMLRNAGGGNDLAFLKTPCASGDVTGRFLVHVVPVRADDLPAAARRLRFDNLDFAFSVRGGVRFDDKCMVRIPLPDYEVAVIRIARLTGDGAQAWQARIDTGLRVKRLRELARSALAWQPAAAHGDFNVYLGDQTLTYVREPCAAEQVKAKFFLHATPADARDLPEKRRQAGFDNLDFRFDDVGGLIDAKCVAEVRIPDYDIALLRTGQYDGVGRSWSVEIAASTSVQTATP